MSESPLKSLPESAVKVFVLTDGTSTVAEITVDNQYGYPETVGVGTSKRRTWTTPHGRSKGDPRNPEIGVALAMSRAFKAAADHFEQVAQSHLGKEE